ncbi:MAG: tetratricopeptide repeat protein [Chloroflexi bacterium]|nr:tetratricopeptide repeat protein [Chloroflexota bacterium]
MFSIDLYKLIKDIGGLIGVREDLITLLFIIVILGFMIYLGVKILVAFIAKDTIKIGGIGGKIITLLFAVFIVVFILYLVVKPKDLSVAPVSNRNDLRISPTNVDSSYGSKSVGSARINDIESPSFSNTLENKTDIKYNNIYINNYYIFRKTTINIPCSKDIITSDEYSMELKDSKAILLDPKNANTWLDRGNILLEMGKIDESIRCYEKAMNIDPSNIEVLNGLGCCLFEKQEYNEAFKCFDNALFFNPEYALAWYNKGIILETKQDNQGAIKAFEKAVNLCRNQGDKDLELSIKSTLDSLKSYEDDIWDIQKKHGM